MTSNKERALKIINQLETVREPAAVEQLIRELRHLSEEDGINDILPEIKKILDRHTKGTDAYEESMRKLHESKKELPDDWPPERINFKGPR